MARGMKMELRIINEFALAANENRRKVVGQFEISDSVGAALPLFRRKPESMKNTLDPVFQRGEEMSCFR